MTFFTFPPIVVLIPSHINNPARGEFSSEAKVQAEREASTLAAVYQGAPPDTPIEPPHLAALPSASAVDDSGAKVMLIGDLMEEELQGGRQESMGMSTDHWLGQLAPAASAAGGAGAGPGAGDPYAALSGMYGQMGQNPALAGLSGLFPSANNQSAGAQGGSGTGNGAGAGGMDQGKIADLLSKIMKGSGPQDNNGLVTGSGSPYGGQPGAGAGGGAYSNTYGTNDNGNGNINYGADPNPKSAPDKSALLSALSALGLPASSLQQMVYSADGGGGGSYNGYNYGNGAGGASGAGGAGGNPHPPPLHDNMPQEDEMDRWRKEHGRGKFEKKKHMPASQNTWKPLCTYFARGR